jgi:hypothetical protein
MWLAHAVPFAELPTNPRRTALAEASESAVDAGALPAQSKMAVGMREPGGVLECGGKRKRHAALAYGEEAGTWCGVFAERGAIG